MIASLITKGGIAGAGELKGGDRGIWEELFRRGKPKGTRDGEYSGFFLSVSKAVFA